MRWCLSAIITLPVGLWAATHKNKLSDHLIRAGFLFALTTPSFWLGILLILLFSLRLHLFPVAGYGTTFPEHLRYLFLPALTLALQLSAVLIRNLRSGIINTARLRFRAHRAGEGAHEPDGPRRARPPQRARLDRQHLRLAVRLG